MSEPERFIRSLSQLPERGQQVARWCRLLEAEPISVVGERLRCLVGMGREARSRSQEALLSLIPSLTRFAESPMSKARLQALYEWSVETCDADSERRLSNDPFRILLLSLPPMKQLEKAPITLAPRWEREVTLGAKKTMASGRDRRLLQRLLLEPEEQIITKLCANPRLTERDILTIATRRPTIPAALTPIVFSRWLSSYEVRHALVLNPFNSTNLSLRLLLTLRSTDLALLRSNESLHPILAEACSALLQEMSASQE